MATQMEVQALLRFLTTNAKLPLATAMAKMKDLRAADIMKVDDVAGSDLAKLQPIFGDEKIAKQVLNAAKRNNRKRDAPSGTSAPAKKRAKAAPGELLSPADLEDSLALPEAVKNEDILSKAIIITNRAPLVLAFAVTLLKYTMPDQPLSSRLSLAQAYVSVSSRDRAVSLGLESGKSAEEEGFGEGQPVVRIMNRDIRVMRRWGYDPTSTGEEKDTQATQSTATVTGDTQNDIETDKQPPLWGIDLEALRKSSTQRGPSGANSLPIHTAQSARAYLLKSFNSVPVTDADEAAASPKKSKRGVDLSVPAQRERNLGLLLGALELLFDSWSGALEPAELDKKTWGWYANVRPAVANGVEGWGGKNQVRLESILKMRRDV